MDLIQIVLSVFVLLLVIYFIINAMSQSTQLTQMADGKVLQTVKGAELKNTNNSSNFTYSTWMYVNDWNYKFGADKIVLRRAYSDSSKPCPSINLGTKPNTLSVSVTYYDTSGAGITSSSSTAGTTTPAGIDTSDAAKNAANLQACNACDNGFNCGCDTCDRGLLTATATGANGIRTLLTTPLASTPDIAASNAGIKVHTCMIENIPIQKWANVIVSLYGRTLDIYLDGKLVKTCVVPGVPTKVDNSKDVEITPAGGFSGWTTYIKYWPNASNPQEAYNIYKDGFGGTILGNLFNKYRMRFSLIKDNVEASSFEI
jgi:hypothetical protein